MTLQLTQFEIRTQQKDASFLLARIERRMKGLVKRRDRYQLYYNLYSGLADLNADSANKRSKEIVQKMLAKAEIFRGRMDPLATIIQRYVTNQTDTCARLEDLSRQLTLFDKPMSGRQLQPIQLCVKLMNGKILTVYTDLSYPVAGFADQFASQNHYHMSSTRRMAFFTLPSDEDQKQPADEVESDLFWTPTTRHIGKSVGDILKDRIPMLHLIIQPCEEPRWKEKVTLLREILHRKRVNNMFSNQDLLSFYSEWLLTCKLDDSANRYQRFIAFIQDRADLFEPLGEQEYSEQNYRMDVLQFIKFRNKHTGKGNQQKLRYLQALVESNARRYGSNFQFDRLEVIWLLGSRSMELLLPRWAKHLPTSDPAYRYMNEWDTYSGSADKLIEMYGL